MPFLLLPFVFDYVKYVFLEKFSKVLGGNTYVNVIIDLYRNANAVALADAKATGKYNLIFDVIFFNGAFKQFYNLRGALQVTRGSHANLNEQHNLHLCQNFVCEELVNGFGSYGVEGVVNGYANAHLAFAHAKCATKLYFITKIVF